MTITYNYITIINNYIIYNYIIYNYITIILSYIITNNYKLLKLILSLYLAIKKIEIIK